MRLHEADKQTKTKKTDFIEYVYVQYIHTHTNSKCTNTIKTHSSHTVLLFSSAPFLYTFLAKAEFATMC